MCLPVLDAIRVPRLGPGRPRTRPDSVLADKEYSSRAIRAELRRRGIVAVIPQPRDEQGHRKRRTSRGGRPVPYDPVAYRGRNVVEPSFNALKHWRRLATRYDKPAPPTAAAPSSPRPSPGFALRSSHAKTVSAPHDPHATRSVLMLRSV